MTPDGWPRVLLRDLGDGIRPVLKAGRFGSALKKSDFVASGYKVYGQENVIAGDFRLGTYFVDQRKFAQLRSCEVKPGDLLVTMIGSFGRVAMVPHDATPGVINSRLLRVSPDRSRVEAAFLKAYLESPRVQKILDETAQRSTMGALNTAMLGSLEIPVPPLEEQRRIVEVLASVEKSMDATQAVIHQLQVLQGAVLDDLCRGGLPGSAARFKQSAVGEVPESWKVLTVGECLDDGILLDHQDGNHGVDYPRKAEFTQEGVPFVLAASITDGGHIDFDAAPKLPEERASRLRVGFARGGDVVLSHNGSLGLVAVIPEHWGQLVIGSSLTLYRPEGAVMDRWYLATYLSSEPFQAQLRSAANEVRRNQVTLPRQKELLLAVPPLAEQVRIGAAAESIRQRILHETRSLAARRAVKAALVDALLGRSGVSSRPAAEALDALVSS
ncbi:MAG: restriction endonuclease subunit S [Myxococcota bacterium]